MATNLKNLKVRKVDFVDEGANPDAHIRMLKSKGKGGKGEEEGGTKGTGGMLKKMLGFIGKAAGMGQEEIDSAMDEIQKGDSVSFSEKISETKNYKIADEIWDICSALQASLCSMLNDDGMDGASVESAMQDSLEEFYALAKESIKEWSSKKTAGISKKVEGMSGEELGIMESIAGRLNESIEKAHKAAMEKPEEGVPGNNDSMKGDEEEMHIDKSKLTAGERAFLESIEKRYGTEGGAGAGNGSAAPQAEQEVTKSAQAQAEEKAAQHGAGPDDVYKGLHPAVAAELAELKKWRESAEEKELAEIAKKYEIIGRKSEELVPVFKSLKAAGGTAYNDMIAMLDQTVDAVEKSGVFSEVGKSGHGGGESSAEAKISTIAKKYIEEDPALSYSQAVTKAWENNPQLLEEYDEQEGF